MEKLLGKNLLFLRKTKGWQQAEIPSKLDIKATTWGNYETGTSQPNLDVLMSISKFFGVSETDLLHKDLSTDAHLIEKLKGDKNHKNAHLNAHPNAHPSTKIEVFKGYKNLLETEFKQVLNEDETPLTLQQRIERFLATAAENEAKTAQKIAQLESKINDLVKRTSKK
jgi:transcriptional regulator with XRE-family HTH domain